MAISILQLIALRTQAQALETNVNAAIASLATLGGTTITGPNSATSLQDNQGNLWTMGAASPQSGCFYTLMGGIWTGNGQGTELTIDSAGFIWTKGPPAVGGVANGTWYEFVNGAWSSNAQGPK